MKSNDLRAAAEALLKLADAMDGPADRLGNVRVRAGRDALHGLSELLKGTQFDGCWSFGFDDVISVNITRIREYEKHTYELQKAKENALYHEAMLDKIYKLRVAVDRRRQPHECVYTPSCICRDRDSWFCPKHNSKYAKERPKCDFCGIYMKAEKDAQAGT